MKNLEIQKICIIGNIASGKTRLANKLSKKYKISVTHVDSIQFDQKLNIKNQELTRLALNDIQKNNQWIIDGYGPLDLLEKRFQQADQIIFLDPPVIFNFFWLTYRMIKIIFKPRLELPLGSTELNWKHIKKMYLTVWKIHKKMHPEVIKILSRDMFKHKVIIQNTDSTLV